MYMKQLIFNGNFLRFKTRSNSPKNYDKNYEKIKKQKLNFILANTSKKLNASKSSRQLNFNLLIRLSSSSSSLLLLLTALLVIPGIQGDCSVEKWTVGISGGQEEAQRVANELDCKNLGIVRGFNDVYLFEKRVNPMAFHRTKRRIESHPCVTWVDPQTPQERVKRNYINLSELHKQKELFKREMWLRENNQQLQQKQQFKPTKLLIAQISPKSLVGSSPQPTALKQQPASSSVALQSNVANQNQQQQQQSQVKALSLISGGGGSSGSASGIGSVSKVGPHHITASSSGGIVGSSSSKSGSFDHGIYATFSSVGSGEKQQFNDELWAHQWYLQDNSNVAQIQSDIELKVEDVWRMGIYGSGVVVSILDDGLEWNHTDILPNYDPRASWDMNNNRSDPFPRYDSYDSNSHGTRCAGEVAMAADNRKCGVGVAPKAKIGGIKCLDGEVADHIESMSLLHNIDHIDIYSGSWGPSDNGLVVDGPKRLASQALERGVKFGRKGKGALYVWANGNGGALGDNCNCDGYVNSIYTISIGGVTQQGQIPFYGERCSSTLAVTCSSGAYTDRKIVTTDLHNKCTIDYTGTSAAAPLAAGVFALALEANSNLTWRDAQHLTAWTSNPIPIRDNPGWKRNAAGLMFNSRFGFGLLNAKAMVDEALKWQNVPKKSICMVHSSTRMPVYLQSRNMAQAIFISDGCQRTEQQQQQQQQQQQPQQQTNGRYWYSSSSSSLSDANNNNNQNQNQNSKTNNQAPVVYLEHVQLIIDLEYTSRGSLDIFLISPAGTISTLLSRRPLDISRNGFDKWPLMSVHFWGESSLGKWTLVVRDKDSQNNRGLLRNATLLLHGTMQRPAHMVQPRVYQGEKEVQPFIDPILELDEDDIYDLNTFPNEMSLVKDDSFQPTFIKSIIAMEQLNRAVNRLRQ